MPADRLWGAQTQRSLHHFHFPGETMPMEVVRALVRRGAKDLKLIGMRVDEAMPLVDKFLDDAFLADAANIRIVHGFGQGRLRAAVRDLLKSHPHVTGFRDGAPNEGGAGATVVDLRR